MKDIGDRVVRGHVPAVRPASPALVRRLLCFVVSVAIGMTARFAAADGDAPPEQKAAAQAIFEQARSLVEQGQFAEACPKFAESERLDPGIGTTLWLADCYENVGRSASAWASFKEAAAAAALRHDEREHVARERASKLEPTLSRLTITVPPSAAVAGLEVRRDGVLVGTAEWGLPLPLDPGSHTIGATAPGRRPWSLTVQIQADGQTTPVSVPSLIVEKPEPAADSPRPAATDAARPADGDSSGAATPAAADSPAPERSDGHRGDAQRIAGGVIAGLGAAAVVVGGVFSLRAKATYDESNEQGHCLSDNECDSTGKLDRSRATSMALVATIAMSAGAAALAGGVILFFAAPKAAPAAVALSPIPGGGAARLTWLW